MNRGQSRKHSAMEAICNVGSGMLIAWCMMQFVLAPALNINITPSENGIVTIVLTVVSMARGYLWRRLFNAIHLVEEAKEIKKQSRKRRPIKRKRVAK